MKERKQWEEREENKEQEESKERRERRGTRWRRGRRAGLTKPKLDLAKLHCFTTKTAVQDLFSLGLDSGADQSEEIRNSSQTCTLKTFKILFCIFEIMEFEKETNGDHKDSIPNLQKISHDCAQCGEIFSLNKQPIKIVYHSLDKGPVKFVTRL